MNQLDSSWHVGPLFFPPWALTLPIVVGALIWLLSEVCFRYEWIRIPLLFLPLSLGIFFAIGSLRAPSGYAAAYWYGGAWLASLLTALASLLLLPLRMTRRAGFRGLIAAGVMISSFYLVFLAGYSLGLYDWWGDRPVSIPPTNGG